jgi:MOSC domain-containing protein YiiM
MERITGRLLAVNVVAEIHRLAGESGRTAIDKRPVDGPVQVTVLGLAGDRQMETRFHGGRDQALYAFAREDVLPWEAELGHPITPGSFGENLTFEGLEVSDALIGERWRIGGDRADAVVVETTMPRTPCNRFAAWIGEPRWVSRFTAHGKVGAYLRVIVEGSVRAGDPVEVVHRPSHGVTVGQLFRRLEPAAAQALVAAHAAGEIDLTGKALRKAQRVRR